MTSVNYFMMLEPSFAGTHWCSQCVQGIRHEVSRSKGILEEVPLGDGAALERVLEQERPLLILVGSLVSWMTETVFSLSRLGIHCIMMTAPPPDGSMGASTISMDYHQGIYDLFGYLEQMRRTKVALFGIHPNSINDYSKQQAYLSYPGQNAAGKSGIFHNDGDLREACKRFYERINQFDAVICSNDIIAIQLQDYLKERNVRIPEELCLVGIGETRLSQLVRPRIATASLSFSDIGHNAVRLYNILRRNNTLTALHAKVRGTITSWESAGGMPYAKPPHFEPLAEMPEQSNFYADSDVQKLFELESLISHCQPIDFDILRGLMLGKPYRQIADEHFSSENAMKYRIKRMLELSKCESKEQMLELIRMKLSADDLPLE